MRKLEGILLLAMCSSCLLDSVDCLPQYDQQHEPNNPPIITPQLRESDGVPQKNESDHHMTKKTQDILEKIKEINIKHGYLNRGMVSKKTDYLHIPSFYSKQAHEVVPAKKTGRQLQHPLSHPFVNPILEYLMHNPIPSDPNQHGRVVSHNHNGPSGQHLRRSNVVSDHAQPNSPVYHVHQIIPSSAPSEDDIPGHYIKRKVIHQQSILVPTYQSFPSYYQDQNMFQNLYPVYDSNVETEAADEDEDEVYESDYLESQTVNNIKNIIQHYPQRNAVYQPQPQLANNYPQMYSPYVMPAFIPSYGNDQNYLSNYYVAPETYTRQSMPQMPYPVQEYFPIVVKSPFEMMFNAMTSMIEYGPQSDSCKIHNKHKDSPTSTSSKPPITTTTKILVKPSTQPPRSYYITTKAPPRLAKLLTRSNARRIPNKSLGYQLIPTDKGTEMTIFNSNNNFSLNDTSGKGDLIIDDLNIPSSGDISFGVRLPEVVSDRSEREVKKASALVPNEKIFHPPQWLSNKVPFLGQQNGQQVIRPSHPDPIDPTEEESSELDNLDNKGIFGPDQNQNKKFISRDNTGSGVFIHKLKVKKGGVAIAGPGGIATAGSGGTAIVGPNGFAYTHPDSLAIAGSGTKVVAVEPTINLSELVRNTLNGTRDITNPRVGKVVAVGPVIYYNKG